MTAKSAQQLLDEVQRLAQLDGFDPARYLDALGAELGAEPDVRPALAAIDAFTARAARIRLDHALAGNTSVAPSFRTHIATMVVSYDGDLETLRGRVAGIAGRVDPGGAAASASAVVDAVAQALAVRARLREGVLALVPPPPPAEEAPDPDAGPSREELIELD